MHEQESYGENGQEGTSPAGSARAPLDTSDPTAFLTELSAAEPTFVAEATLALRIGGAVRPIRIRTVSQAALEQAFLQLRPPKLRKVKAPDGTWQVDDDHPEYRAWLLTHAYVQVLLAWVGLNLRDRTGCLVWEDTAGGAHDIRAAVLALKESGITTDHVQAIREHLQHLSGEATAAETEALLGNSNGGGAFR